MKNRVVILSSIVIVIVIMLFLGFYLYKRIKISKNKDELLRRTESIIENQSNNNQEIKNNYDFEITDNVIGILEIPKIDLKVPVIEGISEDILEYSVGHFENSSNWNGNIALASHNRGNYVAHYFEDINTLEMGDEIIYKTKLGERRYIVLSSEIIDSTDWSVISQTEDNRITLITCIKNLPNKRLCVQAIE